MEAFDFWQKWGLGLNDRQFASAFTALGILAANGLGPQDDGLSESPQFSSEFERSPHQDDLKMKLLDHFRVSPKGESIVKWCFPLHDQFVKMDGGKIALSSINPLKIAKEWLSLCNKKLILKPRFCIISYPKAESIRPWFRLLFEAVPPIESAYIEIDTWQAHLHLRWPLRLGYLPGKGAEESVRKARFQWPANKLTSTVRIDRENANCDVLLFTGSSSQLLKTLLATPVPQKTNLFLVRGTLEDDLTTMSTRLSSIAAEGRASGFVFIDPTVTDEVLGNAFNRFIDNLSHNQRIDIAVSEAFTRSYSTDPVILLSRHLAAFKLEHVLETIRGRLNGLPKAARPKIKEDSLRRMGLPVDKISDDLTIPKNLARNLEEYNKKIIYAAESAGATGLANMSEAIDGAEHEIIDEKRQRFLQRQIFLKRKNQFVEECRAFQIGVPTLIRVRIGPPDKEWPAIDTPFPEEKLPQDRSEWGLTVILTEPNHLKEALRRSIRLPRTGPSTECEFRIQPGKFSLFEGRITVLHRGRILQTGVITGRVVSNKRDITRKDTISFADILAVRSNISDLADRRQFDLAFVFNHASDLRPRLTAISKDHAWVTDLKALDKITLRINSKLSKVAKVVKDYSGSLKSKNNQAMLVELARLGRLLYGHIVIDQLQVPTNWHDIATMEYIQVVSTRSDALIPLEFIYDCETPRKNSRLCPSWQEALTEGICRTTCIIDKSEHVCPLGFWGVSKVIERHALTPELACEGKELFLQSEPTRNRNALRLSGTAVIAASDRVEAAELKPVLKACKDCFGESPQKAKDWEQWTVLVAKYNPHVLLALPHTDGEGEGASMEIGGDAIESVDIKETFVRREGTGNYPLVALLGCDTTGTALEYGSHVTSFRWCGASVVIGTIATVFGEHAAKVAAMLVKGLESGNGRPERLGEVIREIKRQALLKGMLMPLCIVAFGDADWKLEGKEL